jgi:hexulose-6-phosphate isomerase
MKKSISTWSFCGNWNLDEKLRLAKAAGYEGFEIDLSEDGPVNLASTAADLKAVRALAKKRGVALSGLATGLYWGANACSEDFAVRQKAAAILKKQIECAFALGIDAILVVPGAVGVDFIPGGEVVPYQLAYERAKEFIGAAIPAAEKAGVTICIENVWNKFLLSPLETRDFIDSFGSPFLQAYFDVGNILLYGYPHHWIETLAGRIKKVHVKDFEVNSGTFVGLLQGSVDFPRVMNALRGVGYDDYLTAEVSSYAQYPEQFVRDVGADLEAIIRS